MNIIEATVLKVGQNDENLFHIVIEAQIPKGVASVQFNSSKLGREPVINLKVRHQDEPFKADEVMPCRNAF